MLWKRYSLPIRRAVSPLQGSSTPRMAKSTPAFLRILRQRLRRPLVAIVERAGAADEVEVLGVGLLGHRRDVETVGPVRPRARVDAPRVALRLHRLERASQLGREARLLLHQMAPHVDDLVDVLDEHRTGLFAGAAARAGPQHLVEDEAVADDVLPHRHRLGRLAVAFGRRRAEDVVLVLVEVVAQVQQQLARREHLAADTSRGSARSSDRTRCTSTCRAPASR